MAAYNSKSLQQGWCHHNLLVSEKNKVHWFKKKKYKAFERKLYFIKKKWYIFCGNFTTILNNKKFEYDSAE